MAGEQYEVQAVLEAIDKNFSSMMAQASATAGALNDKLNTSTQTTGKTSSAFSGMGTKIASAMQIGGAAVTAIGATSLKSFGDFQSSLNQAAVIAGGTSKDIAGLSKVALKMGQDLPISANQAAEAMTEMARNGASIGDIKKQFPAIAQAATAAGADLTATAGVVQQSMNIWGDSIGSPQQAAAVLVQTANASNASIESMQQALATIGPTAKASGYSMQDMSTAIGLLTNQGQSSAQASQDLNHAILALQAPSKITAGELQGLGVSVTDANGNMKPFPQLLNDIGKSMEGMTSKEKTASLKKLVGTSGMQALGPLLDSIKDKSGDTKTSWDAFSKSLDKVSSSSEVAEKALSSQAADMQNNVGSKIEQVGGAWDSFSKTAMASKSSVTGGLLDMTSSAITWATNSDSAVAQGARAFMGLSPIIGPAMTAVGTLAKGVGPLISGFKAVGGAAVNVVKGTAGLVSRFTGIGGSASKAASGTKQMGSSSAMSAKQMMALGVQALAIGAGIGLATAGFAALVLSIAQLAKTGTSGVIALAAVTVAIIALGVAFKLLGPSLTANALGIAAFGAAVLGIGVGIGAAAAGIAMLVNSFVSLTSVSNMIIPTMVALAAGFNAAMGLMLSGAQSMVPQVIALLMSIITTFLQQIAVQVPLIVQAGMDILIGFLSGIANNIGEVTTQAISIVVNFINAVASQLGSIIQAGVNLIVSFLEGLVQAIPQVVPKAVDVIVTFIDTIAANLSRVIDSAINLIFSFIDGLVQAIPNITDRAIEAVMTFVEGVGYTLGRVLTSGGELIDRFVQGIMNGMGKSKDSGSKNGNMVVEGIKGIGKALWNAGVDLIKGFIGGIGSMAGQVWDAAVDIGKKAVDGVKKFLHIGSPSRVMRDEVGQWIPAGLAVGIEGNTGTVLAAASNMADAAVPDIPTNQINGVMRSANRQLDSGLNATLDANYTRNQTIEVPVYLNSREIARATARDMSNEMGRVTKLDNFGRGQF